jgi:GNAT superfamily N-acetyltransferase
MILTKLTREDALVILDMGKTFHGESQFAHEPFNAEKCWGLLDSTVTHPTRRFIAYDSEFKGFIIMGINEHFFSSAKKAEDFCLYIDPEFRGGRLVLRLLEAAEKWCKENGAIDMTINHNTGINTERAPQLFNKLGFDMKGYIFTKELEHV